MLDRSTRSSQPDLSAPSACSTSQEAVDASLGLAYSYIAQGNTTAALQVMVAVIEMLMLEGRGPDGEP